MERAPSQLFESFSIVRFDFFAPTALFRVPGFTLLAVVLQFIRSLIKQVEKSRNRLRIRGMHSVAAPRAFLSVELQPPNHPYNVSTRCLSRCRALQNALPIDQPQTFNTLHKATHDWHADLVPPQVLENFNHTDVTASIKRQTTLVPGRYTTANP